MARYFGGGRGRDSRDRGGGGGRAPAAGSRGGGDGGGRYQGRRDGQEWGYQQDAGRASGRQRGGRQEEWNTWDSWEGRGNDRQEWEGRRDGREEWRAAEASRSPRRQGEVDVERLDTPRGGGRRRTAPPDAEPASARQSNRPMAPPQRSNAALPPSKADRGETYRPDVPPAVGKRPTQPVDKKAPESNLSRLAETYPKLHVGACRDQTISNIIKGTYTVHSSNHGRPVYRKDVKSKNIDVYIYYWDESDGEDLCGWWFSPQVGGDEVWAFHPSRSSTTPPSSEWNVPHDGQIDPTFRISVVREQAEEAPAREERPAIKGAPAAEPPPLRSERSTRAERGAERVMERGAERGGERGPERERVPEQGLQRRGAAGTPTPPPLSEKGEKRQKKPQKDDFDIEELTNFGHQDHSEKRSRIEREFSAEIERRAPKERRVGGPSTEEPPLGRSDGRKGDGRGGDGRGSDARGSDARAGDARGGDGRERDGRGDAGGDYSRRSSRAEEARGEEDRDRRGRDRDRAGGGGAAESGSSRQHASSYEKRLEDARRQEEERRRREQEERRRDEQASRHQRREIEDDRRRRDDDRRHRDDERRRRDEEERRREDDRRREEDRRRDEERKRRDEERDQRRREEDERRRRDSEKDRERLEYERKAKEEEMKKKDQELQSKRDEKRRQEEAKKREEDEVRHKENMKKRHEELQAQQEAQKKRAEEEKELKENEAKRKSEEVKALRQQQATLTVLQVLQKLSSASPENFDTLKKELDKALLTELPDCGSQQEILAAEAQRVVEYAQNYVQQVLDQRKQQTQMLEDQEKKAKELLADLERLVAAAEESSEGVYYSAAPLLGDHDLDDDEVFQISNKVHKQGKAAMSACSACADFITTKRPIIDEAENLREHATQMIASLLPRIRLATRRTAEAFQRGKENRQLIARRTASSRWQSKAAALFKKYDKDEDGLLSLEEVCAYAKGEFGFDLPEENIRRIERQLFPRNCSGLALEEFPAIKTAVGIARTEVRGVQRRVEKVVRKQWVEERKEQMKQAVEALMQALQAEESSVELAEREAGALASEAGSMQAKDLKEKASAVEAATEATRTQLAEYRKSAQFVCTEVANVAELHQPMQPELSKLGLALEGYEMRLAKAVEMAGSGRQLALYMAVSEYEGLWTEVVVRLRGCIEQNGKTVEDLFDAIAGIDATQDWVTTTEIYKYLEKNACGIEKDKVDKLFHPSRLLAPVLAPSFEAIAALADANKESTEKSEENAKETSADSEKDEKAKAPMDVDEKANAPMEVDEKAAPKGDAEEGNKPAPASEDTEKSADVEMKKAEQAVPTEDEPAAAAPAAASETASAAAAEGEVSTASTAEPEKPVAGEDAATGSDKMEVDEADTAALPGGDSTKPGQSSSSASVAESAAAEPGKEASASTAAAAPAEAEGKDAKAEAGEADEAEAEEEEDGTISLEDLNRMTVPVLKQLCRDRGLGVGGRKGDLVTRLDESYQAAAKKAAEEKAAEAPKAVASAEAKEAKGVETAAKEGEAGKVAEATESEAGKEDKAAKETEAVKESDAVKESKESGATEAAQDNEGAETKAAEEGKDKMEVEEAKEATETKEQDEAKEASTAAATTEASDAKESKATSEVEPGAKEGGAGTEAAEAKDATVPMDTDQAQADASREGQADVNGTEKAQEAPAAESSAAAPAAEEAAEQSGTAADAGGTAKPAEDGAAEGDAKAATAGSSGTAGAGGAAASDGTRTPQDSDAEMADGKSKATAGAEAAADAEESAIVPANTEGGALSSQSAPGNAPYVAANPNYNGYGPNFFPAIDVTPVEGLIRVSRADFMRICRMYYKVVRQCVLSDNLMVEHGAQLRRVDVGEVIEIHCGPAADPSVGVYRVQGRAIKDSVVGWATIAGNQGITFLMPGGRIFTVKVDAPLCVDKLDLEGTRVVRMLKEGEFLEVLEWARTSRSALGVTRIQVRAQVDFAIGWVTVAGNDGTIFMEAM